MPNHTYSLRRAYCHICSIHHLRVSPANAVKIPTKKLMASMNWLSLRLRRFQCSKNANSLRNEMDFFMNRGLET